MRSKGVGSCMLRNCSTEAIVIDLKLAEETITDGKDGRLDITKDASAFGQTTKGFVF
jgi:hypothetical protein